MKMCNQVNKDNINASAVDVPGILEKSGRYQAWQYFLACLAATFVMMSNVNYVFVAGDVDHRCRISECESSTHNFSPSWWPDSNIDSCYRPILNTTFTPGDSCTNDSFTAAVEKCTDLIYESNDTMVAELNLGCEPWKVSFVGTIHGIGSIIAVIAAGWMCDRFGRKPTLIMGAVACVIGNLKVLTTSYNIYILIEFLEGAISLAVFTAGPVIMSENSNSNTRTVAGVLFAYSVYMGEALFACIAMGVPYWKHLLYIIYSPPLLFLSYIYIIDESVRWQIITGKFEAARTTLKHIVKWNKIDIKPDEIDKVSDEELKKTLNMNDSGQREGIREMFKSKDIIIRLTAGTIWRLAVSFIYYCLVVNSVYLPGDKYTNFLMTALISFPGELLSMYLMNKFGRRIPLKFGFIACGITCIGSSYVSPSYKWIKIVFFLIGKLLASTCYTASVVYTIELFPTSVRGVCSGICTLAACAGNMLAPLTPAMTAVSPILTSVCIGACVLLAFGMLFTTPETKGAELPDTIEHLTARRKKKNNFVLKQIECINNEGRPNFGFNDEC